MITESELHKNLWGWSTPKFGSHFNHGVFKIFTKLPLLYSKDSARPRYTYTYLKVSRDFHPQLNQSEVTCVGKCIWEWNSDVGIESYQN